MVPTPMTQAADRCCRNAGILNCQTVWFAILTALLILFSACGKKGPPVPSSYVAPPVVEGLQVILENDIAKLRWPIPEWDGKDENALAGFYVYRSKVALSAEECEDCPVRYKKEADIRIKTNESETSFAERIEKGFRYSYRVSVYTGRGYEGEKSEAVTVDYLVLK